MTANVNFRLLAVGKDSLQNLHFSPFEWTRTCWRIRQTPFHFMLVSHQKGKRSSTKGQGTPCFQKFPHSKCSGKTASVPFQPQFLFLPICCYHYYYFFFSQILNCPEHNRNYPELALPQVFQTQWCDHQAGDPKTTATNLPTHLNRVAGVLWTAWKIVLKFYRH